MSSVRDHLTKFHTSQAEHHVELGKQHAAMAEAHHMLSETHADDEAGETHSRLAKAHRAAAKVHADAAEENVSCCKSLAGAADTHKAASGETIGTSELYELRVALEKVNETLTKQLVPTSVSAVLPDNPAYVQRQNVTPVIRPGQPDLARTQGLDPTFAKFVTVED